MAKYHSTDLKKTFSALYNQQKAYLSGCCHSNTSLDTAEKMINSVMIRSIEDMAVEDIMNGGEHDIKNISPDPNYPVLVVDDIVFCNYQTAKRTNILGQIGCPLDGNYNAYDEGNALIGMINDLQTLSLADFVKKHYIEGEYFNGSAKLISMIERVYAQSKLSERGYSTTKFSGDIIIDDRIKVAVMQFINANTNNISRYENSALFYNDKEIKTVGAELEFRRESTGEDFVLSKLTLQLFIDEEHSAHYPFPIAIGVGEREAAQSLGRLFTSSTYPKYADSVSENYKAVCQIPMGEVPEKSCGGPNDKRTLNQLLDAYDEINRKTSTTEYLYALMNNSLSEEEYKLTVEYKEYSTFMDEWRNALDFVQYTTLTVAMPNSWRTDNYKVITLFDSKDEYIRYFTLLTGGFSGRIRPTLLDPSQYPAKITEQISFKELEVLSGATLIRFRDDANAIVGNRRDLGDVITVPELKELIDATKQMRSRYGISDKDLVIDSFNALLKAERENTANTIYEYCKRDYTEKINNPENDMHRLALSIGEYLYYNATMTIGDKDILIPAGRVDYWYEEEDDTHEITIKMSPLKPAKSVNIVYKDGKLLSCCYHLYIDKNEEYNYELKTQEDIERYIPYPEIRDAVVKFILS